MTGEIVSDERAGVGSAGRRGLGFLLVVFVATTFLSATLLFLVEPMVAKMLLPRLGGSAAVWNTSLVFFQLVLLAGYAAAHLTIRRLGVARQAIVQIIALTIPLVVLPITAPHGWYPPEGTDVALWTLMMLSVMVGLPFLLLSTMSPTLQRWFSTTDHPQASDPYFLYAAGNVGSLGALLAYPILIEPHFGLATQARLWSAGYLLLLGLTVLAVVVMHRHSSVDAAHPTRDQTREPTVSLAWRTRIRWICFAAVPSALMLGVTHHLSFDVASMPMLWVLPLALYLVTFIVAFGRRPERPTAMAAKAFRLLIIPLTLSFLGFIGVLWFTLVLHLAVFACAAMVAHGRLAVERPEPSHLTEFYLLLSIGGAVGGVLAALLAPVVFTDVLEYPITLVLGLLIIPSSMLVSRRDDAAEKEIPRKAPRFPTPRTLVLGVVVVVIALVAVEVRAAGSQGALTASILIAAIVLVGAFVLARTSMGFASVVAAVIAASVLVPVNPTLYRERTFYGVHRVYEDVNVAGRHVLLNGNTVHGIENTVGPGAGEPLAYYHRTGPIGRWFMAEKAAPARTVGVVGMGSGALAAYGREGDTFVFYEIDPAVDRIARDPTLFTFVSKSPAVVETRIGDGRLMLEDDRDARYDLLVLDAFSSDSIPLHLMTSEALGLYLDRITDDGVIAFHISNRYFDFAPVITRLADQHDLVGRLLVDPATPEQAAEGKMTATWVLLARTPEALGPIVGDPEWIPLEAVSSGPLWTDDFSNLLDVFHWDR